MQHTIQIATAPPLIVPIDDLSQIQRKVFAADMVKLANQRLFEDGPDAFDGVGMQDAKKIGGDVLAAMIDGAVRHEIVKSANGRP